MLPIILEEPYEFVPPKRGRFWIDFFRPFLGYYLDKFWGISQVECRNVHYLEESLAAGHGIMLAPNHCRPCDPMVVGALTAQLRQPFYTIASWYLFKQNRFQAWILPRLGSFSVYREGIDRPSLNFSIDALVEAQRPVVIFPEGTISRCNGFLFDLMEGVTFIARNAARRRQKQFGGKVVIHPVALLYRFQGDLQATLEPVLREIEARLSWQPQTELPLLPRIIKLGSALIAMKELEYFGATQSGQVADRLDRLIARILEPLEAKWNVQRNSGSVVARVKRLRMAIVPDLIGDRLSPAERKARWRDLADVYLGQQLYSYPRDYLCKDPPPERLLETVERFEEDLTDKVRIHRPLHATVQVGPPIEVPPDKQPKGIEDPILGELDRQLRAMLAPLAAPAAACPSAT
jgi:1-acyl-sn-glycerol-3-phosphate acyltransferase